MDDGNAKFVDFKEYCPKCKWADKSSTADPCNECLDVGGRSDRSPIPVNYEEEK